MQKIQRQSHPDFLIKSFFVLLVDIKIETYTCYNFTSFLADYEKIYSQIDRKFYSNVFDIIIFLSKYLLHRRITHSLCTHNKSVNKNSNLNLNPLSRQYRSLPTQVWVIMWTPHCRKVFCPTRWPKKVRDYQQSSINRIKNRQCGYISHQFGV